MQLKGLKRLKQLIEEKHSRNTAAATVEIFFRGIGCLCEQGEKKII
jgi:hypothetical protein